MRNHRRVLHVLAAASVLALTAAACGDDSGSSATTAAGTTAAATTAAKPTDAATTAAKPTDAATTAAATTAGGGGASTTAGGGSGTTVGVGPSATNSTWCDKPIDTSVDKENGAGTGWTLWILECTKDKPLKAEGDPIVIGVQNPEGDPAGTFPEYSIAAKAAADYINAELGGFGADYVNGKPGRPVQIELCTMTINPADSTKCANELAAKKPFLVYSTLNFFGNQFPIYNAANIPVLVGTPIAVPDFTTAGVYAIGGGGGCLGVHTGMVEFTVNTLGAKRVGVPWADTPPGVTCYHDLEKKPLNILAGKTQGPPEAYGKVPGLEHIGVPIKPGQADITAQVQQVLDFKPDHMMFSAQGSDCWSFVNTAAKLGWSPDKVPLVLSGACLDTDAAKAAGDAAKGIYFVGTVPVTQPDLLSGPLKIEAQTYVDKMKQYGGGDVYSKGFATQGFEGLMLMHLLAATAAGNDPSKLTQDGFVKTLSSTENTHSFAGTPMGCSGADQIYKSVCASTVTATQWDGTGYKVVRPNFSGVYIIKNTPIDTGKGG